MTCRPHSYSSLNLCYGIAKGVSDIHMGYSDIGIKAAPLPRALSRLKDHQGSLTTTPQGAQDRELLSPRRRCGPRSDTPLCYAEKV
ncbi:hypothetical protein CSOJ01_02915 [Colletotrichum sojae]|uniref:Uncharacterized protein n=1 Tax=Colletotrichum sojae TaxID=2175907 RepID=A0A8H6JPX6_9PEZI|nr:hypothetical protein CSOJ01_02915 [Colletotrichum sojae]